MNTHVGDEIPVLSQSFVFLCYYYADNCRQIEIELFVMYQFDYLQEFYMDDQTDFVFLYFLLQSLVS